MTLVASDRKTLIDRYSSMCVTPEDRRDVAQLWSPTCARLRDPRQFARTPLHVDAVAVSKLRLGPLELDWIDAAPAQALVRTAHLEDLGVQAISRCDKRAAFLASSSEVVADVCAAELEFISDFTSAVVWLAATRDDTNFGNSSFYLAPHITFVSDGSLFFIPPLRQIPREYGGYGFVENLYHESLHHQVHAHCALTQTHYCVEGIDAFTELLDFPCRPDRTFDLFQAINACHVYGALTPLRMRVHSALAARTGANGEAGLDWLLLSASGSLHMWLEFSRALVKVEHKLLPVWRELARQWEREATDFARRWPQLGKREPTTLQS